MTTFYFDASVPRAVPEALALVRPDIHWAGKFGCPAQDWPDTKWLAFAADHDWTVVMRDKHTRSRPQERYGLLAAGIEGAFILTGAGSASKWEVLEILVNRWTGIERMLAEEERPFVCSVTKSRVSRLQS